MGDRTGLQFISQRRKHMNIDFLEVILNILLVPNKKSCYRIDALNALAGP